MRSGTILGEAVYFDAGSKFFRFLGDNGNIVYWYGTGGTTEWDRFCHFTFDDELNLVNHYTLEVTLILPWYEEQIREILAERWADKESRERLLSEWGSDAKSLEELIECYPERTTTGEYYERYTGNGEDKEPLTEQEFLGAFEELTGFSFAIYRAEQAFW